MHNNLKRIGLALANSQDALGAYPSGYVAFGPYVDAESDTSPGWSWAWMVLPQMEQSPLYGSINFSMPVQAPANSTSARTGLRAFICPSDQVPSLTFAVTDGFGNTLATVGATSYGASAGDDPSDVATGLNNNGIGRGVFYRNSGTKIADLTDWTSLPSTRAIGSSPWRATRGFVGASSAWTGLVRGTSTDRLKITTARDAMRFMGCDS